MKKAILVGLVILTLIFILFSMEESTGENLDFSGLEKFWSIISILKEDPSRETSSPDGVNFEGQLHNATFS